jgi:mannose-1-phosphate guanylyltransferase
MVMKPTRPASEAAILLAGGQSTRLFPFNKVLSDLTGSGRTLIQQARHRLKKYPAESIYVLTTQDMAAAIRKQLALPSSHILVDPVRRGTWPAILWAMAHLRRENSDAVLAVLTGDHVIRNDRAFHQALQEAVQTARQHPAFVMLGIPPRSNATEWRGFGCLRTDEEGRVIQFKEKPVLEEAQHMIEEGGWLWNSGMFFFRITIAEEALSRLQPEMARVYEAMKTALAAKKTEEAAFIFEDFQAKIPHPLDPGHYVDNSIDYAIMTPLVVRPEIGIEARAIRQIGFQWTDLGQWDALRTVLKADRRGNIRVGKTVLKGNIRDSIFVAEAGRTIEAHDVQNVIVAFAGKTALVVAASHLAHVKEVAQEVLKHADRIVIERDVRDGRIQAADGRVAAIGLSGLSIKLAGHRLVVSTNDGFIR